MNEMSAFIYGMVTLAMISNLIFMIVDARRMKKESEKLDKMGRDIMKDIEVGKHYIEMFEHLDERLSKLENKEEE